MKFRPLKCSAPQGGQSNQDLLHLLSFPHGHGLRLSSSPRAWHTGNAYGFVIESSS